MWRHPRFRQVAIFHLFFNFIVYQNVHKLKFGLTGTLNVTELIMRFILPLIASFLYYFPRNPLLRAFSSHVFVQRRFHNLGYF